MFSKSHVIFEVCFPWILAYMYFPLFFQHFTKVNSVVFCSHLSALVWPRLPSWSRRLSRWLGLPFWLLHFAFRQLVLLFSIDSHLSLFYSLDLCFHGLLFFIKSVKYLTTISFSAFLKPIISHMCIILIDFYPTGHWVFLSLCFLSTFFRLGTFYWPILYFILVMSS